MGKLVDMNTVLDRVQDGATLMIGGFMGCGTPHSIMDHLVQKGVKNLTVIANDTAVVGAGIGKLVDNEQIGTLIASHIGLNPKTGRQMTEGRIEVELVPQGTLAERIRAGGAGLGGFLTPTGLGTVVQEGKRVIQVDGKEFLLELPLRADVALIKAFKADERGNLVFRLSARNFNPVMATAADYVVAEVEQYVDTGDIAPDEVHLPGVFVDAVVLTSPNGSEQEGVCNG
ncbi:MAG: branched-chain amino acid dehydrogenase [Deltaproteobacteria bacterium HGW-Deltaproteobacteria-21]|nr:MAG: branched-chain amino acid dehydrogenase [Deltaproteobacteria bacterium HGW-Deltaproteobacteria-21]